MVEAMTLARELLHAVRELTTELRHANDLRQMTPARPAEPGRCLGVDEHHDGRCSACTLPLSLHPIDWKLPDEHH